MMPCCVAQWPSWAVHGRSCARCFSRRLALLHCATGTFSLRAQCLVQALHLWTKKKSAATHMKTLTSLMLILASSAGTVTATPYACDGMDSAMWIGSGNWVQTAMSCSAGCRSGAACTSRCMSHAMQLSMPCASCVGAMSVCTRDKCPRFRRNCFMCDCAAPCLDDFESCSGFNTTADSSEP